MLLFIVRFFFDLVIFIYWASEASPTLGCSIEISHDICIYVGMSRMSNELRRRKYVAHAHAQSHFLVVKTDL